MVPTGTTDVWEGVGTHQLIITRLPDLATWEVHLAPRNRRWRLGDFFSRIWCFWRVFSNQFGDYKKVTEMQYVYSTVYAAAGGGGRESIYNDYRLFQNRLLSKKCMKFSILAENELPRS